MKILKTVSWTENKDYFVSSAFNVLGVKVNRKCENFAELVDTFSGISSSKVYSFLESVALRNNIEDITPKAVLSEDHCLFSSQTGSALEIVLHYLCLLNHEARIPQLVQFLDDEEKAVVCFVNNKGWHARIFCCCSEDFSTLHLVKNGEKKNFILAQFAKDISAAVNLAQKFGSFFLHDYRPSVKYDFLGTGRTCRAPSLDSFVGHPRIDNGDFL